MNKNKTEDQKRRRLFQNLGAQGWQNLALAGLLAFYLAQFGLEFYNNNLYNPIGSDFLAFWSAGYIANTLGYENIYDLSILKRVEEQIFPAPIDPTQEFFPIPAPFLSIFILPFKAFALFPPKISFWLWTVFNLSALILYLRFFTKEIVPESKTNRLLFLFMLSYPVYLNLYWGQINVWLVICVGEFMRAALRGKALYSGLWLGGLLLKPQILILIIPVLLLKRAWEILAGFGFASGILLVISIILSGLSSLDDLASLWINYASGLPTNAPESMMNWRMLGLQLSAFTNPTIGWGIATIFMLIIMGLWLRLFLLLKPYPVSSPKTAILILGTFAATNLITWHSHLHMMILMLPILIYLVTQNLLPYRQVLFFVFAPPIMLMVIFILGLLVIFGLIPIFGHGWLIISLVGLIINLSLLVWASKQIYPNAHDVFPISLL
jgi:hypothetical protein